MFICLCHLKKVINVQEGINNLTSTIFFHGYLFMIHRNSVMLRRIVFITSILLSLSLHADVNLTNLATNGISKWEHKSFEGETRYESLQYKERAALKATSKHAASGYYLKKKIDLLKTP